MAANKCYDAVPLDSTEQSIRLLRRIPQDNVDPMQCELRCFTIGACPSYTALSYTWGAARPLREIDVNCSRIHIRENLWYFLDELRRDNDESWYWVDAICIDQSNTGERNHQVQMMREIYLQASTVTIWLGQLTSTSELAFSCVDIQHHSKNRIKAWWWHGVPHEYSAILNLCQMTYWTRIWVVQEIMLAQRIIVRSGHRVVPWTSFENMVAGLKENRSKYPHHGSVAVLNSDAVRLIDFRMSWQATNFETKGTALDYLLHTYGNMESTEVRDKVYGLLGLVDFLTTEEGESQIAIDYSMSVAELFVEVNRHLQAAWEPGTTQDRLRSIETLRKALGLSRSDIAVLSAESKVLDKALRRYNRLQFDG